MLKSFFVGIVALCLAIVAVPGRAQPAGVPLTVAGVSQLDLQAASTGRPYRVFVGMPAKPAPESGYAVLYVLDGNAMFLTALEAVRAYERRPDVPRDLATVVVGIGYPEGADIGVERTLDLTPAGSGDRRIKAPSGGADDFLRFIEQDLKPRIGALAKIDPERQGIFGHSFGGLFVLHALASGPGRFQHYMAASPSVWFADPAILDALSKMAGARAADAGPVRALVMAAEYEQSPSPWMRAQPNGDHLAAVLRERRQVDRARAAAETIAKGGGIEVRFNEIAGEDHGTVIPAAISRAVLFMLAQPLPVPAVPTAREYLDMGAEQRYGLRLRVRDLPDNVRIPWLNQLKKTLHDGLTPEQAEALHEERNRMDAEMGTRPHAVNASN